MSEEKSDKSSLRKATFGAGCFWCVEALFQNLEGVKSVTPGYAGGRVEHPTYQQVCSGETGHAEVVRIVYDPETINYEELLNVFWKTHDPTTPNRQGNDVGEQYRSVIFYHNEQQQRFAQKFKDRLDKSDVFEDPVVTEISPLENYYEAEDYHKNYYNSNPDKPYCQFVIKPKLDKLNQLFGDKVRTVSDSRSEKTENTK
jgi:peptide-methionine (S)-S-oxide reductase